MNQYYHPATGWVIAENYSEKPVKHYLIEAIRNLNIALSLYDARGTEYNHQLIADIIKTKKILTSLIN